MVVTKITPYFLRSFPVYRQRYLFHPLRLSRPQILHSHSKKILRLILLLAQERVCIFQDKFPSHGNKSPGSRKINNSLRKKNNAPQLHISLLPLPPAARIPNQKQTCQNKHSTSAHASFRKVPFFAALVECSKDSDQHGSIGNFSKISRAARTLTDRLGFMSMHTNISCKNTCAVSESMVYLPRSSHDIYSINTRHPR
ncbi:hypothetical protein DCAR_0101081 [Daucus carota subsp. sativus]|uniref:Uncharacterized protein n=1 Tax=Daucus carota subsp. sativus TaxID=79200 RepID=A0AAF0W408_DAUCS|nr:hypothetical protein DCAR_0101081 [Daucus carota subsp. sativus]